MTDQQRLTFIIDVPGDRQAGLDERDMIVEALKKLGIRLSLTVNGLVIHMAAEGALTVGDALEGLCGEDWAVLTRMWRNNPYDPDALPPLGNITPEEAGRFMDVMEKLHPEMPDGTKDRTLDLEKGNTQGRVLNLLEAIDRAKDHGEATLLVFKGERVARIVPDASIEFDFDTDTGRSSMDDWK
jgi:hypothetical protein